MSLKIIHRDHEDHRALDRYIQKKFKESILNHFHLNQEQVDASIIVDQNKHMQNEIHLHFHHRKNHQHYSAYGPNVFQTVLKTIRGLERKMSSMSRKNFRKKQALLEKELEDDYKAAAIIG